MESTFASALAAGPNVPAGGAEVAVFSSMFLLVELALIALIIAGMWGVFAKAGEPGWAALIPIYNLIVLLRVAGKPWWWFFPCLIPIVGLILSILIAVELSNRFGMGGGFAVGLIFLPFVFYPILGFGSAEYEGRRGRLGLRKRKKRRRPVEDDFEDEEDYAPRARGRAKRPPREDVDEDVDDEDEPPRERRRPKQRLAEEGDEELEREEDRPPKGITASRPQRPAGPAPVRCPECGVTLKIPGSIPAGKRVKCPKCSTVFAVPG